MLACLLRAECGLTMRLDRARVGLSSALVKCGRKISHVKINQCDVAHLQTEDALRVIHVVDLVSFWEICCSLLGPGGLRTLPFSDLSVVRRLALHSPAQYSQAAGNETTHVFGSMTTNPESSSYWPIRLEPREAMLISVRTQLGC